jgi:hypothetical protein
METCHLLHTGLAARGTAVSQSEGENVVTTKELREITKDDFYSFLSEHADRLVVLDFYTNWVSARTMHRCPVHCVAVPPMSVFIQVAMRCTAPAVVNAAANGASAASAASQTCHPARNMHGL